jgi:hypothetical protein
MDDFLWAHATVTVEYGQPGDPHTERDPTA